MFFQRTLQLMIQLFFLLTPFFGLSVFLSLSDGMNKKEIFSLIAKTTLSILIICYTLIFAGKDLFNIFGITVDAFRIGAGAMLFLNSVDLVRGKPVAAKPKEGDDIAVVPLAIPIIVGPATIGALLVMGSEFTTVATMMPLIIALPIAVGLLMALFFLAPLIVKLIGKKGVTILSRLTGLILAALSAQMMFTGLQSFIRAGITEAVAQTAAPPAVVRHGLPATPPENPLQTASLSAASAPTESGQAKPEPR